jgi:hypothetical protein
VGYAQGDNVDNPEFYTVRQRDAHAWPEVYFPAIGWVEFEPTVSQPVLVRPQELATRDEAGLPLGFEPPAPLEPEPPLRRDTSADLPQDTNFWQSRIVLLLAVGLALALVALLIPLIRRKQLHKKVPLIPIFLEKAMLRAGLKPPRMLRNMALLASLSPLERAYQQINLALARLGRKPAPKFTPAERAATLVQKLPPAKEPAQVVIAEYHRATYSPRNNADQIAAQNAGNEIRRLSFRASIKRKFGL